MGFFKQIKILEMKVQCLQWKNELGISIIVSSWVAEETISKFEDLSIEIIQSEEQKENWRRMTRALEIFGTLRCTGIHLGIHAESPRSRKEDKGAERLFKEIIAENILDLKTS